MYWLRNTLVPNIAMPTAMLAITASNTVRRENSSSGISGSSTRRSTATAATISAMPRPTRAAVCQDSQSKLWPASETQISSADAPPAISVAPR